MSSAVVEPGHVIAGRYRVERLLGQGAMGSVYRAVQLSMGRSVALKLLVDEHRGSAPHIERFEREAQALSRLAHPNTVRLFDFGTSERGCPFLVMELLSGSDLADDLERQGPLRWDQALSMAQAVAASLAEAHAASIVHRDIKPANIFLCADGAWPRVKVLDFGIAGNTGVEKARKLTLTGTVVGSAAYMSPEQAQGLPVGPASDLYGLGVVLFEAMTGKTPFATRVFTAQLLAKLLESAPALRDVCPGLDVPPGVQALVGELLDRDPSRRPPSSSAVVERIEALLERASLPPLTRTVLPPLPHAPTCGVGTTQPMLVARTIDEGWAPPKTGIGLPRHPPPPRRSLAAVLAAPLIGSVSLGVAWLLWSREPNPAPRVELASLAPPPPSLVARQPALLGAAVRPGFNDDLAPAFSLPSAPLLDESTEPSSASAPIEEANDSPPAPSPPPRRLTPSASHPPAPSPAAPPSDPASATANAPATSPSSPAPSTSTPPAPPPPNPDPAPSPDPAAPAPPVARPLRFPNLAAVRQALAAGVITPLERNRIILKLSERRYEARARAADDYQAGRISRRELRVRQRAIEREFEGF
jgi:serine/threonine protein kinase